MFAIMYKYNKISRTQYKKRTKPRRVRGFVCGVGNLLIISSLAVSEGFEPPVRCRTPVFEAGSFNHSDNSPESGLGCKVRNNFSFFKLAAKRLLLS